MKNFASTCVVLVLLFSGTVPALELKKFRDLSLLRTIAQRAETEPCSSTAVPNLISGVLDGLRTFIQNGIPSVGSLDPLQISFIPIEMDSELARGSLELSNFIFSGLSAFALPTNDLVISSTNEGIMLDLDLDISFTLQINTDYEGSLALFELVDLFGEGNIIMNAVEMVLDTQVGLRISIVPFQIEILDTTSVSLVMPQFEARITGLINDDFMSDLIGRQLADTLTMILEQEAAAINGPLQGLIDGLIDLINGLFNPPEGPAKVNYRDALRKVAETALIEIEKKIFDLVDLLKLKIHWEK